MFLSKLFYCLLNELCENIPTGIDGRWRSRKRALKILLAVNYNTNPRNLEMSFLEGRKDTNYIVKTTEKIAA